MIHLKELRNDARCKPYCQVITCIFAQIFARKRTANPRGPCTILGILSSITTVRKPHVKTEKKKKTKKKQLVFV